MFAVVALFATPPAMAFRGMFVDGFDRICGNAEAERDLLGWASQAGFDELVLYGLPELDDRSGRLSDPGSDAHRELAEFVRKARRHGIVEIGAVFESLDGLSSLEGFRQSESDSSARLDAFVLEFEWWSPSLVENGGIYCRKYLLPMGVPCTEASAWSWASRLMVALDTIADRSGVRRVVYASSFDRERLDWIVSHADRLLLSDYVFSPEEAWPQARARLDLIASGNLPSELAMLWSAEGSGDALASPYLGDWLAGRPPWNARHRLAESEGVFLRDWDSAEPASVLRKHLVGFQWFAWSHLRRNLSPWMIGSRVGPMMDPSGRRIPMLRDGRRVQSRPGLLIRRW